MAIGWSECLLPSYLWGVEDPSRHQGKSGKGRIVGQEKPECMERARQVFSECWSNMIKDQPSSLQQASNSLLLPINPHGQTSQLLLQLVQGTDHPQSLESINEIL